MYNPRGMCEVYLASSALIKSGFDGLATIRQANMSDFDGVQLFLDQRYREAYYRDRIVSEITTSGLGVVIHLPNEPIALDIAAARDLRKRLNEPRMLIHYSPRTAPPVADLKLGWENSKVGPLTKVDHKTHVRKVRHAARRDGTFFVFDAVRMAYVDPSSNNRAQDIEKAKKFIKSQIATLSDRRDLLHIEDKTSWVADFRDSMCVLGEGIMGVFVEQLQRYRGIVILEHENLEMAIESRSVLIN